MKKYFIYRTLIPFNKFIHYQNSGGIVLLIAVILALFFANSPMKDAFHHFWETPLRIGFNQWELNYSLHHWINDGLMAMFFFVVGLELKREIIIGELSTMRKASLPIAAAVGGMVIPALVYMLFNAGLPSQDGWGIPMATDIVFTLALMGLVRKKVPLAAKIFLVALATVDDLGAVLVIAFFYTSQLSFFNLLIGLGLFCILLFANFIGIRNMIFYAVIGIGGVWLAFLLSGVHATIAGVLVAFTIPARKKIDERSFSENIKDLIRRFDKEIPKEGPLVTPEQNQIIEAVKVSSTDAQAPLQKLEIALHPWVTFLVIPLFAISNAGVEIGDDFLSDLVNPVTLGIVFGLIFGKLLGVTIFTYIMVKFKIANLPKDTTWKHIFGLAFLAGVGFTMSLFITNLAFSDIRLIEQAKYGILLASLVSGIVGVMVLKSIKSPGS